jgi:hypothetical protein
VQRATMGFSFVSAATAAALVLIGPTLLTSCAARDYEVWAADQSNTAPGQGVLGVKGGLLWIWDGKDVEKQVEDDGYKAVPLPCIPGDTTGPCDILKIFPPELVTDSTPSTALGEMSGFGRLHGALIDPLSKYAALSMFVPGGGYIGIVDTVTKEAIALFRTTRFGFTVNGLQMSGRSVHMNEWSKVSRWKRKRACTLPFTIPGRPARPASKTPDSPRFLLIFLGRVSHNRFELGRQSNRTYQCVSHTRWDGTRS